MRITLPPRPRRHRHRRGLALIIVMIVIVVLGVLAAGFSYSMKVETRLAQQNSFDTDLEWLGRSGVELARYILSQGIIPNEPWDSLNQKWAGGPMGTNEVLAEISLVDNQLGRGSFSIRITDLERKFNVNLASEEIWRQALSVAGVDPSEMSTIIDAYLDWRDPDNNPHLAGAESSDYLANPNPGFTPHVAKNGPIDDVAELLMLRGVTEEVYWGPRGPARTREIFASPAFGPPGGDTSAGGAGLVDLFTAISAGTININTASAAVLQLIPGVDPSLAQGIIQTRSGLDGTDGTEDDVPFRSPGELINVPGMVPQFVQGMQGVLSVRSVTFEVLVEARIGHHVRQYIAILRRLANNPRNVQVISFHWH